MSLTAPLKANGDREFTLLLAGQSAALGKDTNAAALIESLAEETSRRLRHSSVECRSYRLPQFVVARVRLGSFATGSTHTEHRSMSASL